MFGDAAESTGQFRSAFAYYRPEIRATRYYRAYHRVHGETCWGQEHPKGA
jgi:hypothetical protein